MNQEHYIVINSQFSKEQSLMFVLSKATKYMEEKLTELQRVIDEFHYFVEDFNCLLSEMDTNPAVRKSVRTYVSSTVPSINWSRPNL